MRILVVSQYYDPEPVYLPGTIARGLAERGHDVTVVTGFPNYPGGKVYSGFRQRPAHREQDGAVKVLRTPIWISHSKNPLGRILNYLSFAVSSFITSFAVRNIDVVYVYSAQMTASLGPSLRRFFRGTPYVLHVQDLWPESVTGSSMVGGGRMSRLISALLKPWLTVLYKQATATVAIAPTMAKMLVARGVPSARIRMVFNWANEKPDGARGSVSRDHGTSVLKREEILVVYAGNLGDHQDLETVIRAAKAVETHARLRFELYGAGVAKERLEALAQSLGVNNLEFCGTVGASEIKDVYAKADFQLITLLDREIFRGTIPSKFQAALFSGSAIMTNVSGDVASICSNENFGLTCEPGSVEAMAEMFIQGAQKTAYERQSMAANGRRFYLSVMSLDQGLEALEDILIEAATAGKMK
ncbi:glycosyltransferase family 4 protein [[Micrococcus luteus] ATCC 49442]|uniref:glycosyltransferase family 4 protein n=1 Tax=[Micrococcus luteus] ATCC 49442 TaxID=2698727 RepID=UPI0013DA3173|nr:glycosyltransferase family 4 protein [[Micrococcus luteus] ATCC 49442]